MKLVWLGEFADVPGQARFISRCRIPMYYAFIYRFIDQRNRRVQKFLARRLVTPGQSGPKFLDLRPQFTAVAAVDLVSRGVLPNAFFC